MPSYSIWQLEDRFKANEAANSIFAADSSDSPAHTVSYANRIPNDFTSCSTLVIPFLQSSSMNLPEIHIHRCLSIPNPVPIDLAAVRGLKLQIRVGLG